MYATLKQRSDPHVYPKELLSVLTPYEKILKSSTIEWYLNTGATHHVTYACMSEYDILTKVMPYNGSKM